MKNYGKEDECFVVLKYGKPKDEKSLWYLDAVEEALCFGWIDSSQKVIDGIRHQRFSPRRKGSVWTELNKERVRRLEKLNLMTDAGRTVLPDMNEEFKMNKDIEKILKKENALDNFNSFPELYKKIRIYNINFYKKRNKDTYEKALKHFIEETKKNKMFGQWNDYGRLL